jgi:hypothetical protein
MTGPICCMPSSRVVRVVHLVRNPIIVVVIGVWRNAARVLARSRDRS